MESDNKRCEKYMSTDITKVLQFDENICKRIEGNDQKLKDLVYSNYTKFIQVTETITHIRQNAETFDNDLITISKTLNELNTKFKGIHSNLSPLL